MAKTSQEAKAKVKPNTKDEALNNACFLPLYIIEKYNGKITKRGTLPLSEEVKYVAAQYFPWKKNQVSPLSLVHPHKS